MLHVFDGIKSNLFIYFCHLIQPRVLFLYIKCKLLKKTMKVTCNLPIGRMYSQKHRFYFT